MSKVEALSDDEAELSSTFSNEDQELLRDTVLNTRSNYPRDTLEQFKFIENNIQIFEEKFLPSIQQSLPWVPWLAKPVAGAPRNTSPPSFAMRLTGNVNDKYWVWYDPVNDIMLIDDGVTVEMSSEDLFVHRFQFLVKPPQNV